MSDPVAEMLADHPEISSWTIDEVQARLRFISQRLVKAIQEQRDVAVRFGQCEADYQRTYHETHLASCLDPERESWTVAQHESAAKVESAEINETRIILKEQKMALRSEIDGLKTVLEVLRSHGKTARELGGGGYR